MSAAQGTMQEIPAFDAAAVIENLPDPFCAFDRDWRFTCVNAAAERILERPRASLLGRDHWQEFPETLGTEIERVYRRVMADRQPATLEHAADGRWFLLSVQPVGSDGLGVWFRETTSHRQAEERLRLAVESAGLGLWEHDLTTDRRVWSEETRRILGLPPDVEPTLDVLRGLIHPQDREVVLARHRHAFDPAATGDYTNEFRIRRHGDGQERWVAIRGRVFFDTARRPVRALGIFLDITGPKRQELALRSTNERLGAHVAARTAELHAERARLGAVLDQLPYGILVSAPAGAVIYQNEAARALFGRDLTHIAGFDQYGEIGALAEDGTPLPAQDHLLARSLHEGRRLRARRRFAPDGGQRLFEIVAGPVRNAAGDIALGVVALEDVTQRVEAEETLLRAQRMEAVGQLTGGLAHDFNNLLTVIAGNLERLRPHQPGLREQRMVDTAMRAADRGARLTAQLLAFARRQRLQPRPTDIGTVLDGMSGLLGATLGGTVAVRREMPVTLWPALADVTQLELMVLNLAINARDAMPGGGALRISAANAHLPPPRRPEDPPAGEHVALTVSDTGSGMPREVLDRAFEPFFTTKGVGRGTGLGLPHVLGVAQQLGGGVRIESSPGAGTSVTIYLPRATAPLPDAETPPPACLAVAGLHVLLVDDDPDVRQATAAMLRDLGTEVIEAESGEAALRAMAEGAPCDAALLDYAMPGMTGADTAARLHAIRPDLKLVLVTGYADMPDAAIAAGITRILHKPFRTADLQRLLAAVGSG